MDGNSYAKTVLEQTWTGMTINHFYHVYADGQWQEPVTEHLQAIKDSGLDYVLNGFHVGLVGSGENRAKVIEALNESGLPYSICAEANDGWEQVTINRLHQYVKDKPNGWVLYAHTKSAANTTPINIGWRKSMTYFNIVRWKELVEPHLGNINVDTIGCHWCLDAFWGGTYWWARASYLAALEPPLMESRHQAEEWVGWGKPRIIDLNPGWPDPARFTTSW